MTVALAQILTDVTLREGSQQERDLGQASVAQKMEVLEATLQCGIQSAEITGFAPGSWFSDADEIAKATRNLKTKATLRAIYFNTSGAESLCSYPHLIQEGIFHTAATDQYRIKNYGQRSVDHALTKLQRMLTFFQEHSLHFDSCIISTAWGDAGEPVESDELLTLIDKIGEVSASFGFSLGQITLADTVGHAAPDEIQHRVLAVRKELSSSKIALHLHPHPDQARESVIAGIEAGTDRWEGAWGSVGGSPFASGCGGNLDIRTLIDVYHEKGLPTGLKEEQIPALMDLLGNVCGRSF